MTTIYPGLGKTGPWALNDSAVVLNGLLMPDGSLQRTPGNTPTVDGVAAPAVDIHRIAGGAPTVSRGQRFWRANARTVVVKEGPA